MPTLNSTFLGDIMLWPLNSESTLPAGWLPCDGRIMNVRENQALYSILANRFGGDGVKTFALPDLRSRVPVGVNADSKAGTPYRQAATGGRETHEKWVDIPVPEHTHGATFEPGAKLPLNPLSVAVNNDSTGTYSEFPEDSYLANGHPTTGTVRSYAAPAAATGYLKGITGQGEGIKGGTVTVDPEGNGSQILVKLDLRQPYLPLNYVICATGGSYPPRAQ